MWQRRRSELEPHWEVTSGFRTRVWVGHAISRLNFYLIQIVHLMELKTTQLPERAPEWSSWEASGIVSAFRLAVIVMKREWHRSRWAMTSMELFKVWWCWKESHAVHQHRLRGHKVDWIWEHQRLLSRFRGGEYRREIVLHLLEINQRDLKEVSSYSESHDLWGKKGLGSWRNVAFRTSWARCDSITFYLPFQPYTNGPEWLLRVTTCL